jgi:sigma-B regulation protein RsbU (phosphoserine phosphatase)
LLNEVDALPGSDELIENAPCGLLLTLDDGTIKRVNLTFCHWLGMPREAVLGRRFQDLLSMGGKLFHQTHCLPLLQMRGSVAEVKLDLLRQDGSTISMMFNAVRRQTPQGYLHELALFGAQERTTYERELTAARKMAEELLLQQLASQKELSSAQNRLRLAEIEAEIRATFAEQMVGFVSHDLRNPLAAIKMAAGLIGLDELSERQQRSLGHVLVSVERAQRLIVNLLDFTQARVGRGITVLPQAIDLHKVIGACVEELRLMFPGRTLIHRIEGEGPCSADADRLFELVENLVSNAVTYGAPDGEIVVTSAFEAQWIKISVHNQGPAIDLELIGSLFEPMLYGVAEDNDAHTVGLGLFIVREIARAHWGDVSLSSSEEQGTTFVASLARPVG